MLPQAFANLAMRVGAAVGAPYYPGRIIDVTDPVQDEGGSIITPGSVVTRTFMVQIDVVSDANRPDGWTDRDYRFLVLAATLDGGMDTDAEIEITEGPHAGKWMVSSLQTDPAGIGYVGKGRPA